MFDYETQTVDGKRQQENPSLEELVGEFSQTSIKITHLDPATLTDAQLCDTVIELRHNLRRIEATHTQLLAELDTRETCDRLHGHNTTTWVSNQLHEHRVNTFII